MINQIASNLSPRVFIAAHNRRIFPKMSQPVTAAATRRENLQRWVAQHKQFADAATALDMSPSQLSQIAGPNPRRNIGTVLARRLEIQIRKPEGWLDVTHEEPPNDPSLDRLFVTARHMANQGKLNENQVEAVRRVLELVTEDERGPYIMRGNQALVP